GCTGEALSFEKDSQKFYDEGYTVLIVNMKTPEQHKQVFQDRDLKDVILISDPTGKLAKALDLTLIKEKFGDNEVTFLQRITLIGDNKIIRDIEDNLDQPNEKATRLLQQIIKNKKEIPLKKPSKSIFDQPKDSPRANISSTLPISSPNINIPK